MKGPAEDGRQFWAWAKQTSEELRRVVMSCWDPIGVADLPQAADEYDAYLPMILAVLRDGEESGLKERLSATRTQAMGLPPDPVADENAARRIFEWYREQRAES